MDRAKNNVILATLEKHGGTCTFQVIMDVAEEVHCDVASAALTSLKRKNKVDYEGMMLLLPKDADVVITMGAGGGAAAAAPAPKAKAKVDVPKAAPPSGPVTVSKIENARYCKKCNAVFEMATPSDKCAGGHANFMCVRPPIHPSAPSPRHF